jgi:hypothetical protein
MQGVNRGLFSKLNSSCKNKQKSIHGELSGTLPLKREQTLLAVSPPWRSAGKCIFLCIHGGGGKVLPPPQCVHCQHMKRQPSLCHCHCCRGCCYCNCRRCHRCRCHLRRHCCQHCRSLLPLPLPSAIAFAVAVAHHPRCLFCVAVSHRHHRCPCRQPLLSPSPLAITVAISIGYHGCRHRRLLPRVVVLAWQE